MAYSLNFHLLLAPAPITGVSVKASMVVAFLSSQSPTETTITQVMWSISYLMDCHMYWISVSWSLKLSKKLSSNQTSIHGRSPGYNFSLKAVTLKPATRNKDRFSVEKLLIFLVMSSMVQTWAGNGEPVLRPWSNQTVQLYLTCEIGGMFFGTGRDCKSRVLSMSRVWFMLD